MNIGQKKAKNPMGKVYEQFRGETPITYKNMKNTQLHSKLKNSN